MTQRIAMQVNFQIHSTFLFLNLKLTAQKLTLNKDHLD